MSTGHAARFLKFGAVGVVNTAIDFAVFWALYKFAGAPLLAANTAAVLTAALNSYILNKVWTFGDRSTGAEAVRAGFRFLAFNLVGLGIANATIWILSGVLPVPAAKAASILITMTWNYWSCRRFVYRHNAL